MRFSAALFFAKKFPRIFLLIRESESHHCSVEGMGEIDFEQVTKKTFPELDQDLVPYVASILEENQTAAAEELEEILSPILMGYEVIPEEEISKRCKTLPSKLHRKKAKQK